jgi:hypothetical protein
MLRYSMGKGVVITLGGVMVAKPGMAACGAGVAGRCVK